MQRSKLKIGDEVAVKWCGVERAIVLDFGWTSGGLHGIPRKLVDRDGDIAVATISPDGRCHPLVISSRSVLDFWTVYQQQQQAKKQADTALYLRRKKADEAREARWVRLRAKYPDVLGKTHYAAEYVTISIDDLEKLLQNKL